MELAKAVWTPMDGVDFQEYLTTLGRPEKAEWTCHIINTALPCLAILSPKLSEVIKGLARGNFASFLALWLNDYYENQQINGALIMKIPDFDVKIEWLWRYVAVIDNWACVDSLDFNVKPDNADLWWKEAESFRTSKLPFARRLGVRILFSYVDDDNRYQQIYNILDSFENESEYYVNMINAWLLSELFIKRRERTLEYFACNKLNKFTCNKAISKCRDSFRVTADDKALLLGFRK